MPSLVDAWPALALLAILACMPWLARRIRASGWQGLKQPEQPARLVSALAVGAQQRVVTIEVHQGAQTRRLLLGVTPQSVTLLEAWSVESAKAAPTASTHNTL